MTLEELEAIDRALSMLVVVEGDSKRAKSEVMRFNTELQKGRARLASVRSAMQGSTVPAELEVELRAYALMFARERERIAELWGMPLSRRVA
jgi:hypothetical protein